MSIHKNYNEMQRVYFDLVKKFLSSSPRNKIVIHNQVFELKTVDVGRMLSKKLLSLDLSKSQSIIAMEILRAELDRSVYLHEQFGKILSLENLGILFENDLKQDLLLILEEYSKNNILFLRWEGEYDSENLYFLSIAKGEKIMIKGLSHIKM